MNSFALLADGRSDDPFLDELKVLGLGIDTRDDNLAGLAGFLNGQSRTRTAFGIEPGDADEVREALDQAGGDTVGLDLVSLVVLQAQDI